MLKVIKIKHFRYNELKKVNEPCILSTRITHGTQMCLSENDNFFRKIQVLQELNVKVPIQPWVKSGEALFDYFLLLLGQSKVSSHLNQPQVTLQLNYSTTYDFRPSNFTIRKKNPGFRKKNSVGSKNDLQTTKTNTFSSFQVQEQNVQVLGAIQGSLSPPEFFLRPNWLKMLKSWDSPKMLFFPFTLFLEAIGGIIQC